MTDNETPKVDNDVFFVMNEDGNMDSGPTLEQAAGRLDQNYAGNLLRAIKVTVHMAPPTVEDQGNLIIADAAGINIKLTVREP
jgi:hypothetical protein